MIAVIESPFRGSTQKERELNIAYAKMCREDSIKRGEAPFASHLLYPQVLDEDKPEERKLGLELAMKFVAKADIHVVYADLGITAGMQLAIEHARELGLKTETRFILKINKR